MAAATLNLRVKGLGKQKIEALTRKAERLGLTKDEYVRQLLEDDLELDQQARTTFFAELMAPVREDFRRSGMSEADLDAIVKRARSRQHEKPAAKRK
jgi:hypothetical protein